MQLTAAQAAAFHDTLEPYRLMCESRSYVAIELGEWPEILSAAGSSGPPAILKEGRDLLYADTP